MNGWPLFFLLMSVSVEGQAPPFQPSDPRIATAVYDAGQVYRLNVAARYQLTVLFGADETVENVAVGDSDAWQVSLNGNGDALFVQPLRANGPTNMTVITDRRVYNFELMPRSGPAPDTPFSLKFVYPEPTEAAAVREGEAYRLSGARHLRPSSVTDDGAHTFIDWEPGQTLPAVFALGDHGAESLVEGHVRDGRYVIDSVHPVLVFRRDRQAARATRPRVREAR